MKLSVSDHLTRVPQPIRPLDLQLKITAINFVIMVHLKRTQYTVEQPAVNSKHIIELIPHMEHELDSVLLFNCS